MFNKNLNEIIDAETPFAKDEITKEQFGHYGGGRKSFTTKEYQEKKQRIMNAPIPGYKQ